MHFIVISSPHCSELGVCSRSSQEVLLLAVLKGKQIVRCTNGGSAAFRICGLQLGVCHSEVWRRQRERVLNRTCPFKSRLVNFSPPMVSLQLCSCDPECKRRRRRSCQRFLENISKLLKTELLDLNWCNKNYTNVNDKHDFFLCYILRLDYQILL